MPCPGQITRRDKKSPLQSDSLQAESDGGLGHAHTVFGSGWHISADVLFEAQDGGTLVKDIIDYIVPGGAIINKIFVEPDVRKIFRHRQQRLAYIFPTRDTSLQAT